MSRFDARGLPPTYALNADLEITPAELAEALRTRPGKVTIIDVRTEPEWAFARVAGSVHVPLDRLAAEASRLDIPADHTIAVMCHHGRRSVPGALALREAGFAGARSIAGGLEQWSLAVDAGVPRYKRDGLKVWPA